MADVNRAMYAALTAIKGIIHMSMILSDQAFPNMTTDHWGSVTKPKVTGAWNLHEASRARKMNLSFFILFSSLSGVLGQPGQANYAAANSFLDAFARYRASLGLPRTALDIGAVEGVGYLSENDTFLRKMRGMVWQPVQEEELLRNLSAVMSTHGAGREAEEKDLQDLWSPIVNKRGALIGLSSPITSNATVGAASTRFSQGIRLAAYLNKSDNMDVVAAGSNVLEDILSRGQNDTEIFKLPETTAVVASEIWKKLSTLSMKPDSDPNISLSLSELGLDSLVAVELRVWCKQVFRVEISVLEMLATGTLEALGKKITGRLAQHA
jgi:acyl carrier protein